MPFRKAAAVAVHLPEEEPQEEGDGVLLVLHVGQIPQRALQLHRPACSVHSRKSNFFAKAKRTLLKFLQNQETSHASYWQHLIGHSLAAVVAQW